MIKKKVVVVAGTRPEVIKMSSVYMELKKSEDLCLIVSNRSLHNALTKISRMSRTLGLVNSPLSGIVITGDEEISPKDMAYIRQHNIPVVRTYLDTYGTVIKISRIEVKINRSTPWKMKSTPKIEKAKRKTKNK